MHSIKPHTARAQIDYSNTPMKPHRQLVSDGGMRTHATHTRTHACITYPHRPFATEHTEQQMQSIQTGAVGLQKLSYT